MLEEDTAGCVHISVVHVATKSPRFRNEQGTGTKRVRIAPHVHLLDWRTAGCLFHPKRGRHLALQRTLRHLPCISGAGLLNKQVHATRVHHHFPARPKCIQHHTGWMCPGSRTACAAAAASAPLGAPEPHNSAAAPSDADAHNWKTGVRYQNTSCLCAMLCLPVAGQYRSLRGYARACEEAVDCCMLMFLMTTCARADLVLLPMLWPFLQAHPAHGS